MGLKDMFGWLDPKSWYTNERTAANALQNNPNAEYNGYHNMANSASPAQRAQAVKDEPPKVNLNEGAWSISISQLVDLWVVKFGSKWVDHEEIVSDEFYQIACTRLEKVGRMEMHHLQGHYMPVFKIVE
jgi:hypothetical protein